MALKDFKFENLPQITQTLIVVGLALFLGAIFYIYYLKEMITARDALQNEVAQLEASVAQSTAVAGKLAQFKKDLADMQQRLTSLRSVLPDQKETSLVFRGVQEMATVSNLRLTKFNPRPVVARSYHSDWPILIEAQGSYMSLGQFFERISKFARIINVDDIALRGIDNSVDPSRTLTATCIATTFVFRESDLEAGGK